MDKSSPVFPITKPIYKKIYNKDIVVPPHPGMTLYQYYCGQALAGLMAQSPIRDLEITAELAHRQAIAMLRVQRG